MALPTSSSRLQRHLRTASGKCHVGREKPSCSNVTFATFISPRRTGSVIPECGAYANAETRRGRRDEGTPRVQSGRRPRGGPMRVLHVITTLAQGSAEQQLRLLLRGLPHDCEVVTLAGPGAGRGGDARRRHGRARADQPQRPRPVRGRPSCAG